MTSDSLEAIYAALPDLRCQGKCQEACGPIDMSEAEQARFRKAGKAVPDPLLMLSTGHTDCPHLTPVGRCSVYGIRPLVCRLFGVVEALQCEWAASLSATSWSRKAAHSSPVPTGSRPLAVEREPEGGTNPWSV